MASIYIDPSAATNGNGSLATPYNTWTGVPVGAGNKYFQKRGTTWTGTFPVLTAGTSGNLTEVGAYYNADGSDDTSQPKPIIDIGDSALQQVKDFCKWTNLSVKSNRVAAANDTALIWVGNDSEVSGCDIATNLTAIGASNVNRIKISGNTITAATAVANNYGVYVTGSTMDGNQILSNAIYLGSGGGSVNAHGIRCSASATQTGLVINGNTVTSASGAQTTNGNQKGIWVYGAIAPEIGNNSVTNLGYGVSIDATASSPWVHHNTCNSNLNTGIYINQDISNALIEWNTCRRNGSTTTTSGRGIIITASGLATSTGHVVRFNSCAYNVNGGGPSDDGSYGVGIWLTGGVSSTQVYGNTVYANEGSGIRVIGTSGIENGGNIITCNYLVNNGLKAYKNVRSGTKYLTKYAANIYLENVGPTATEVMNNLMVGGLQGIYEASNCVNVDKSYNTFVDQTAAGIATAAPVYSRNSEASYFDFQGLMRKASVNAQRKSVRPDSFTSAKNLLQYSEDFGAAAWNKASSGTGKLPTTISNYDYAPDGVSKTATLISLDRGTGTTSSDISYLTQPVNAFNTGTFSLWLKTADGSTKSVTLRTGVNSFNYGVSVTGTWTRFTLSNTAAGNDVERVQVLLFGNANSQSADILAWGAQLEAGNTATAYVPSREAYQLVEGASKNIMPYSERFDKWTKNGATNTLTLNYGIAPDGSKTSTLVAGSGTRYYTLSPSELASGKAYTYSLFVKSGTATGVQVLVDGGVTSSVGFTFATGVLSTLNNAVSSSATPLPNGWWRLSMTIIANGTSRSFHLYPLGGSAEFWGAQVEETAIIGYGPELVTNGTVDTDTTGWTASDAGSISLQSGSIRVTRATTATYPVAYQTISLVAGKVYQLTCNYSNNTGATVHFSLGGVVNNWGTAASGSISFTMAATASTTRVEVGLSGVTGAVGASIDFDNISVKEVTLGSATSYIPTDTKFVSRASGKSYYDKYGVLRYAGNDQAAYDYDPATLRYENLLRWSEDCSKWGVNANVVVTANAATAPDGTMTASKVVGDSAAGYHRIRQDFTGLDTATHSVYVKSAGSAKVGLKESAVTGAYATFNLSTGAVISTLGGTGATIQNVGNGWYRISYSVTSASQNFELRILPTSYTTGDPSQQVAADAGNGVYVWGAQLNSGSTALEYIKTEGTAQPKQYAEKGLSVEGAVTNLQNKSETGTGWNLAGTGPATVTNGTTYLGVPCVQIDYTAATPATYAGSHVDNSNSIPVANDGTYYVFSAFVSLSRPLVGTESLTVFCTGAFGMTGLNLTAANSSNYVGKFTRFSSAAINYTGSNTGNNYFATYVGSALSSPVSLYVTRLQFEVVANASGTASSYVPSNVSFTSRASTATYFDKDGVLQTAAANVARYTYDPGNLSTQPWLMAEGQGTNYIQNNTMVGASVGSNAVPTGWSCFTSSNGVNRSVVGVGTDNGIDYIDMSFTGTATGTVFFWINTIGNAVQAASSGQVWAGSMYAKVVSGTKPSTLYVSISGRDVGGSKVEDSTQASIPVTSAPLATCRVTNTLALTSASNAYISQFVTISATVGEVVNFTLRIGLPQLEGLNVTSPIKTSTVAVTRSADVVSYTTGTRAADIVTSVAATREADVCNIRNNVYKPNVPKPIGDLTVDGNGVPTPAMLTAVSNDQVIDPLLGADYMPANSSVLLDTATRGLPWMYPVMAISDA